MSKDIQHDIFGEMDTLARKATLTKICLLSLSKWSALKRKGANPFLLVNRFQMGLGQRRQAGSHKNSLPWKEKMAKNLPSLSSWCLNI